MEQARPTLIVVVVVAALGWSVYLVGPQWAEAVVQGIAALGGLGYWAYRTRPRVNVRIWERHSWVYLEVSNVGNRIAKNVELRFDPPITRRDQQGGTAKIGPNETFGDMDRGQRYVIVIGYYGMEHLEKGSLRIAHDRPYWYGTRTATLDLGGSGWNWVAPEDIGVPLGDIATGVGQIAQKLPQAPPPNPAPF